MTVSTHTIIPVDAPDEVMRSFVEHIEEEHDAVFETASDGSRFVENSGFRIAFSVETSGLRISIAGPVPDMLVFFKEAVAVHVAEMDPQLAANMRWSGETAKIGDLPENFRVMEVTGTSVPLDGLVRVTLKVGDSDFFASPGIHIKVMLPALADREPSWPRMGANGAPVWPEGDDALHARYMTVRSARPDVKEIDIDVAAHGDGLISSWAMTASPGKQIGVMGPAGTVDIPSADVAILAADLTGLPTIARALEERAFGPTSRIFAEAPSLAALQEYLGQDTVDAVHLPSDAFSAQIEGSILDAMNDAKPDFAFFAGEFSDAQSLRKVFKGTFGLGKGQQLSVPYWRHGLAGFES